jgi:hypothetical protein
MSASEHRYRADHSRPIEDEARALLMQVPHIGPRRAERLINALGIDWPDLLDIAPEPIFATLRGVGPRRSRAAARSWTAARRRTTGVCDASAAARGVSVPAGQRT